MKFTIRDLFWLTLVVAACCAWQMQRLQHIKDVSIMKKELTNANNVIYGLRASREWFWSGKD